MKRILVTPRSLTAEGHPALDALVRAGYEVVFSAAGRQPTEEELLALLPGCVGYLAGVEKVTARVLHAAADLRVISRNGAGIDNIDLDAARRRGIHVCRAEGANSESVAQLAVGLLLSLARSIPFSNQAIKAGGWQRRQGVELHGKTLGVIGCGKIGRRTAEMALALGMAVRAYDPVADESFRPSAQFRFDSFENVLTGADAISLHCPPQADGKPLIDAGALNRMRQGMLLVNTARYDLLDAEAVLAALNSGRLGGVALDVFDREPPVGNPLVGHERVIVTPHIGGYTRESTEQATSQAVKNLLEQLAIAPGP
jgi:D-3-phosphoglycerate dehydrogenase / 2-oxoglutarate reductase